MTGIFRITALLIASWELLDPALSRRQPAPAPVTVHLPAEDDPDFAKAAAIRDTLVRELGREVQPSEGESPRAMVAIGNAPLEDAGVPVFTIAIPRVSPSVRPVETSMVDIIAGQKSAVSARFNAVGMRGARSDFVLSAGAARLGKSARVEPGQ